MRWAILSIGVAILVLAWKQARRREAEQEQARIAEAIKDPVEKFGKLSTADYDRVLREAERRRGHADSKRSEAVKIATGGKVEPQIRLQGRR